MKSLPPELTDPLKFLDFIGVGWREARFIWWNRNKLYRSKKISKKDGTPRFLLVPQTRLLFIQRRILPLLEAAYTPRLAVHGFVNERSHITNAKAHVGRRYLINIDLQNFFGSIYEARITGLLNSLGTHPTVSELIGKCCCLEDELPQGAPTSPILSNMVCFRMDREFMQFAKANRILYTRYADDISLSTHNNPSAISSQPPTLSSRLTAEQVSPAIRQIVSSNGFELNNEKLWFLNERSRKRVTGIVTNQFANVDRRFVRNLRTALFKAETLGWPAAQLDYDKRTNKKVDLQSSIRSKITYFGYIRGRSNLTFRSLAERFNTITSIGKISFDLTDEESLIRSIWVVEYMKPNGDGAQGTAFFISDVGLVTAYHCVETAMPIELYHPIDPSKKFGVSVIKSCKHRDIAILQHNVPTQLFRQLAASPYTTAVGDEILVAGYPHHSPGKNITRRSGEITGYATISAVDMTEVSVDITKGISGGPILNSDGSVIAISHKGGKDSEQNIGVNIHHLIDLSTE